MIEKVICKMEIIKKITSFLYPVMLIFAIFSCSREVKEVIYQIPIDTNVKECSIIFSQNANHFAFIKEVTEGEAVVYDGNEGKVYTSIEVVSLSPNGENLAFLALDKKKEVIVKNGNEIARYNYMTVVRREDINKTLQFLNDSELIYTKKEAKKMKKVIKDGKPIGSSPYSSKPEVGRDGTRLLYWLVDGTGDFLVFDGKRQKIAGIPLFLSISGDGEHYGAIVRNGKNKNSIIIDGDKKFAFDSKDTPIHFTLSEKGKHYCVSQRDAQTNEIKIKFDGEVVSVAKRIFKNTFAFSNDDLHYAFIIVKPHEQKARIFTDGKEMVSFDPDYSNINECFREGRSPIFSPKDNRLLYAAGTGTNQILALDQKIQLRFDLYNNHICHFFFSSDHEMSCLFFDKVKKQIVKITKNIL